MLSLRRQRRLLCLYVALAFGHTVIVGPLLANPRGGVVTSGRVAIDASNPSAMTVRQYTDKAIVNWQGFSNRAGESIRFAQPGARSAILNRVTGTESSVIDGALKSNGRVFLLNPNGVLIGKNATVNVGGLVASTLSLSDSDFLAGRHELKQGPAKLSYVINKGKIEAAPGGSVALVGPLVSNEGEIKAPGGRVALAAGTQASLALDECGLVKVAVRHGAPGTVEVTKEAASQMMADVVNTGNVIDAGSMTVKDGVVQLKNAEGLAINAGKIDVNGAAGNAGRVRMESSQASVLTPGAVITANGQGTCAKGGDVRVLSQGTTSFARGARITAQGDGGGDGGFVEVSAKRVSIAGTVDTSSKNGKTGTYLIDPDNLSIVDSNASFACSFVGGTLPSSTDCGTCQLGVNVINAQLRSTNVEIQARSSITFRNTSNIVQPCNPASGITFKITGQGPGTCGISVNVCGQPGSITARTVTLTADAINLHNANAAGGDVVLNGASAVTLRSQCSGPLPPCNIRGFGTAANPIRVNTPNLTLSNGTGGGAHVLGVGCSTMTVNVIAPLGPDFQGDLSVSMVQRDLVVPDIAARIMGDVTLATLLSGDVEVGGLCAQSIAIQSAGSISTIPSSAPIVARGCIQMVACGSVLFGSKSVVAAGAVSITALGDIVGVPQLSGANVAAGTSVTMAAGQTVDVGAVLANTGGIQIVTCGTLRVGTIRATQGAVILSGQDIVHTGAMTPRAGTVEGKSISVSAADTIDLANVGSLGSVCNPLTTCLAVESTTGGNITIQSLAGQSIALTNAGNVTIGSASAVGSVRLITSGSGALDVGSATGRCVTLESGGTLSVGSAFATLGDVVMTADRGDLSFNKRGGEVSACMGTFRASTLFPGSRVTFFGESLCGVDVQASSIVINSAGDILGPLRIFKNVLETPPLQPFAISVDLVAAGSISGRTSFMDISAIDVNLSAGAGIGIGIGIEDIKVSQALNIAVSNTGGRVTQIESAHSLTNYLFPAGPLTGSVVIDHTGSLRIGSDLRATGDVTLEANGLNSCVTLLGKVQAGQNVCISTDSAVLGRSLVTAPNQVTITAQNGAGGLLAPLTVDTPNLNIGVRAGGLFVEDIHASPVRLDSSQTVVGDISISTPHAALLANGSDVVATGAVKLLSGDTLTSSVTIRGATVLLGARNGIGTAAASVSVDAPNLQLQNLCGGGAFINDTSVAQINLDTRGSTIGGPLAVHASDASLTVDSFGAASSGDVSLKTMAPGAAIFAVGNITSGPTAAVHLCSAGRIDGEGFITGGSVQLDAVLGAGSASTPLNVNASNLAVHDTGSGGAFLNVGQSVTLSGNVQGDFYVKTPGGLALESLSATGAFNLRAAGAMIDATGGSAINLTGGQGDNELAASIVGLRSQPIRVDIPAGTLRLILASAAADGVSAAVAGTLLPENNIRLDAPLGSVLLNDVAIFTPPVNLFADGQLNFAGSQLFPSQFDLSQANLAAAAGKDAWSRNMSDKSMGVAGAAGRMMVEEDLAREIGEAQSATSDEAKRRPAGTK